MVQEEEKMKEILERIKDIIAEADAKIQVKIFMKSLDDDWTDEKKAKRVAEYQSGLKDPQEDITKEGTVQEPVEQYGKMPVQPFKTDPL
jgi:predicted transcriptional regulator